MGSHWRRQCRLAAPTAILASLLLTSAAAAEFAGTEFGDEFWSDTCGTTGHQPLKLATPLSTAADSDVDLVAVSVVVRHGARNFLEDPRKACYADEESKAASPPEAAYLDSGDSHAVDTEASFTTPPASEAFFAWTSASELPTLAEPPALDNERRCPGCLLSTAWDEFASLGEALRSAYLPLLSKSRGKTLELQDTRSYATGNARNLESLYLLRTSLFPDSNQSSVPYYTRPLHSDAWAGHAACPYSTHVAKYANRTIPAGHAGFEERWEAAVGEKFTWPCHDPMIIAWCADRWQEVLGFPISRHSPLAEEAFEIYAEQYWARYMDHMEATRLAAAPVLFELHDMLQKQATGSGEPLSIWSTQDIVIANILAAVGLWNVKPQWPQYAEALVFELYIQRGTDLQPQTLFRLLRRGVPLKACDSRRTDGLCSLADFIPAAVKQYANASLWNERCHLSPPSAAAQLQTSTAGRIPLVVVVLCTAGFLAGIVHRLRPTRCLEGGTAGSRGGLRAALLPRDHICA